MEGDGLPVPIVQPTTAPPRPKIALDPGRLTDDAGGLLGLVEDEVGPPQADQVERPVALLRRVPQPKSLVDVGGR